jgi:hypothetical protein
LAGNTNPDLNEEIRNDVIWYGRLVNVKTAWRNGDLSRNPEPVPQIFFSLAKKYSGGIALGEGRKKIFEIRSRINDYSLIDEFFTRDLFSTMPMFSYTAGGGGVPSDHWGIDKVEFEKVKKKLLFSLFNRGDPVIEVVNAKYAWSKAHGEHRGTGIYLKHSHEGADLKRDEMEDTLRTLFKLWQHPVYLETVLTEKGKKSVVPPEILRQLGVLPPEEKKERRGKIKLYFTSDGKEIAEFEKGSIEVESPY